MLVAIGMPGPTEIVIILVVVVLLFGTKKIPDLARSLGKAKGEFKKGVAEGALEEEEAEEMTAAAKKKKAKQIEADEEKA